MTKHLKHADYCVHLCVSYETKTAVISLNNKNQLVFVVGLECGYCERETEFVCVSWKTLTKRHLNT
jgi:non-canonical (house-cleaning) NTP pyrophosphatase